MSPLENRRFRMPLLHKIVSAAAGRMPKVIGPSTHALIDYAVAGSFLLMGTAFWSRNKRAAIGAFVCGGAIAANSLLTDYPGGVSQIISYKNHGRIDAGFATLTAALPRFMEFGDEPEARFFGMQALGSSLAIGMTDFDYYERRSTRRLRPEPEPKKDQGIA
jgi:hypothetical protein